MYTAAENLDRPPRPACSLTGPCATSGEQKRELCQLGHASAQHAKTRQQHLGRNDEMPWATRDLRRKLGYLHAGNVVIVPAAHTLLRGLLRSLLGVAFETKVSTVTGDHPIVFNSAQRKQIKVCLVTSGHGPGHVCTVSKADSAGCRLCELY
jgi:hypothetical protein